MKAKVAKTNGMPISKPSPLMNKVPAYWTKNGITILFLENDWTPSDADVVEAIPGMVGVNWRGSALYVVLADGECEKLTDLEDEAARNVMYAVDQRNAEIIAEDVNAR